MVINLIVKITSRAWSLKILALMQQGVPGRQAPLLSASGASRTAFAQSLVHLVKLGLLERNPGHGHPLRPEYRLTQQGREVAAVAERIERLIIPEDQSNLLRKSWSIPVLAVSQQPRYFGQIKRELGAVTDRSLSQAIQQLRANHWLERAIDEGLNPPRPVYQAVGTGLEIGRLIPL